MSETLKLIFMGIFQGIAEFLPISSSGHLAILQNLFHFDNIEENTSLSILLHIGTLISIFLVYYKEIWELILEAFSFLGEMFKGKFECEKNDNRKLICMIIVASIPTGIIGLIIEHFSYLHGNNNVFVGSMLLVTALILFLSAKYENGTKDVKKASWLDSFIIGIVQGFAVFPGISRSGSTITCAMYKGFNKELAVKFSFFMSMPVILLAGIKDLILDGGFAGFQIEFLYSFIAAVVAGYISIKVLIEMIKKKSFSFFAWYCLAAGLATIFLL